VGFDYRLYFYWPSGHRKSCIREGAVQESSNLTRFLAHRKISLSLILVVACSCLLFAHKTEAAVRLADKFDIAFDRLSTEDGLSQSAVTTIAQDQQGFIWIGTQEGINRYDGYKFESFYHLNEDPTSVSHNSIRDILPDSSGRIWIATDHGVDRFNELTGTFEAMRSKEGLLGEGVDRVRVNVLHEDSESLDMQTIYEVAHNIAKLEEHVVDGKKKQVYVHRKGATRAFGPHTTGIPKKYQDYGQPVIIPGDMGSASYLLAGTEKAMKTTFGSTCHGAGRRISRAAAKRKFRGDAVIKAMAKQGIYVRATNKTMIAEEAHGAYKDVNEVVRSAVESGISKVVARLTPVGVTKG